MAKDGITIRTMKPAECAEMLNVADELSDWFDDDARTRALPIDLRHQRVLVAVFHRELAGFVTLFVHEGRLNIGWIGVRQDFRRQGVGRELIHAAEDHARFLGITELAVMTLGASVDYPPYEATRRFFRAAGFTVHHRKATDNPDCPEELHMIRKV